MLRCLPAASCQDELRAVVTETCAASCKDQCHASLLKALCRLASAVHPSSIPPDGTGAAAAAPGDQHSRQPDEAELLG
jgi:hypothetical protein